MPGMPTDGVPEPEPEPEPAGGGLHPISTPSGTTIWYHPYQMKHLKLVVVGDWGVGKTSLLATKLSRQFPDLGVRHFHSDSCMINLLVDGQPVSLKCEDTE